MKTPAAGKTLLFLAVYGWSVSLPNRWNSDLDILLETTLCGCLVATGVQHGEGVGGVGRLEREEACKSPAELAPKPDMLEGSREVALSKPWPIFLPTGLAARKPYRMLLLCQRVQAWESEQASSRPGSAANAQSQGLEMRNDLSQHYPQFWHL